MNERQPGIVRDLNPDLWDKAVQGIFLMDARGMIVEANRAGLEMIGVKREQLASPGCGVNQIVLYGEDGREMSASVHPPLAASKSGQPVIDQVVGLVDARQNCLVWLSCNAVPLFHQDESTPSQVFFTFHDISPQKEAEAALKESEDRLQLKLDSILNPAGSLEEEELRNILDIDMVQKIINDFHRLTGMTVAIGDTEGNLLVAVGFQDICQKFHRVHPGSRKNCLESDLFLARTLNKGEHAAYKCKKQLWDVVSPIYIGNKHVGNIFTGQYFYDDEEIDPEVFKEQALWYDFDIDEYMKALKKVPRFSREQVDTLMDFLVKFAELVSDLSCSNVKLTRAMVAQKRSEEVLKETEGRYLRIADRAGYMIFRISLPDGCYEFLGGAVQEVTGYSQEAFRMYPLLIRKVIHPDWLDFFDVQWQNLLNGLVPSCYEFQIIHQSGQTRWIRQDNLLVRDAEGRPVALEGLVSDITERKEMEGRVFTERAFLRGLIDSIPELVYYRDAKGVFLGCNRALLDFTGATENDLAAGLREGSLSPPGWVLDLNQDRLVLANQEEIENAQWVSKPDGSRIFLETRKFPFRSETGELLGMISISSAASGKPEA